MAYVPPHKRVSKAQDAPPPRPAKMIPQFQKSVNLKDSSRSGSNRKVDKSTSHWLIYAKNATSRWLAAPSVDDMHLPSLYLVPVCVEFKGHKVGEKRLTLVTGPLQQEKHDTKSCDLEHMWAPVIGIVHEDLLSAFENIRNELLDQNSEEIKTKIFFRFGKVLFRRNPSFNPDFVQGDSVSESYVKDLRRMFYTNVPIDYMEHIRSVVVPELNVQFEEEKELYYVKISDAERTERHESTIACKCRVKKDEKKLEVYKFELNQVRYLIEDISCLESNVDLRLALYTKRILRGLSDEEEQHIGDIISSAILDSNVKGGLRWPLGKANPGGRFSVLGVWHTKAEAYNNSFLRLEVREADGVDFDVKGPITGEVKKEISLGLTGISKKLLEQNCDNGSVLAMLEDAVKLIRNHFLAWDELAPSSVRIELFQQDIFTDDLPILEFKEEVVDAPPPTRAKMNPQFQKSVNLKGSSRRGSNHKTDKSTSYLNIYAENATSRWLAVASVDDMQLPYSLYLAPVCIECIDQKAGEKLLTLVNGNFQQEQHDTKSCDLEHMWAPVIGIVHEDLLSAFEKLRNELVDQTVDEIKPRIVFRFGKVLFRWNPLFNPDFVKGDSVSESYIKNLKRMFHTNVPIDYMEHIKNVVVPELGFQFEEEKELYHVKISDAEQLDSTISCKCRVKKDEKKLELYKIELNQIRYLVEDISCLESNVDLRLALCRKRILRNLSDEEEQHIGDIISSAILDSNVKGGLRWPLGKANPGGRYSVIGIWHTKAEAYNSSFLRLKMREADRFYFLTATGEATREINLGLTGITKELLEQNCDNGSVLAMFEDAVKLIQNHFLAWDGSIVSCSES